MELTINLPVELATQIQAAAARRGCKMDDYVLDAVKSAVLKPSLDELLAPVRAQFAASEMSEEEFDELIETERQALWNEKHEKAA